MISTDVRKTLELITHSLDQHLLEALAAQWGLLAREPGGFGSAESAALHYCLLRRREPSAIGRKALYVVCAAQAAVEAAAARARFTALTGGSTAAGALASLAAIDTVAVNAALDGVPDSGAVTLRLAERCGDAAKGPAMTVPLANEALEAGIILAADAAARFDIVGLACLDGHTNTPASALVAALFGGPVDKWVYCEPSLDPAGIQSRLYSVRSALVRHQGDLGLPFEAMRSVGSIDQAVMTGFVLGAALKRLPVVIDGYAATVAALMAKRLSPDSTDVCIFSHANGSAAHSDLLNSMAVTPVLTNGISEEGGFGAALAIHHLDVILRILGSLSNARTVE
jgi:nicotinate-nucleotide--dimethylbenzimidazole phosphoribosyltransferase